MNNVPTVNSVPPPRDRGWAFVVALLVSVGCAMGAMHVLGKRELEPEPVPKPPALLTPAGGAFATGGRPIATGPARVVFKEALPEFVIALDSWVRSHSMDIDKDMAKGRGAVMAAAREAGLDEQVTRRLEELIVASMRAAEAEADLLDDAADELMKSTLRLNDALATANLGFFVDSTVRSYDKGRSILLFSFEIHQVILYSSQGHDVRTLRVRRLDNLNWSYSLLGFTSPRRRDAVVLDNKVDERVVRLLPALAEDIEIDPFNLPVKDTREPWFNEFRTQASEIIKEELGGAGDKQLVAELGTLLAKRADIYRKWNDQLVSRRMSVDLPEKLEVTWNYRAQMEGLATHREMDELDTIQKRLAKTDIRTAFATVQDHFARSVERHEVQHRLDLAELYKLPMPEELAEYVGELPEGYRGKGGLASSSLAEMSAYLSELARDPLTSRLNLTLLTGFALDKRMWGMAETYAALVIIEGLADELEIDRDEFVVNRRIDRNAVFAVYRQLAATELEVLRDASRSLWGHYFEATLPELALIQR